MLQETCIHVVTPLAGGGVHLAQHVTAVTMKARGDTIACGMGNVKYTFYH